MLMASSAMSAGSGRRDVMHSVHLAASALIWASNALTGSQRLVTGAWIFVIQFCKDFCRCKVEAYLTRQSEAAGSTTGGPGQHRTSSISAGSSVGVNESAGSECQCAITERI